MPQEKTESPPRRRTHFWDDLTPDEQSDLAAVGRPRRYQPGMVVCNEGDESEYVLAIQQGWVKVTAPTDDGRNVFLAVRGPGDLIGESAMFLDRQRIATVTSLGELDALLILSDRFNAFLDVRPRVSRLVTRDMVRRLDDADRRVKAHASADGQLRLVLLLVYLAELSLEYSEGRPGGEIPISAPLTQAELGSWVDASRETAARAFRVLRGRDLVRTGWRKITVVDLPRLRAYADERKAAQNGD